MKFVPKPEKDREKVDSERETETERERERESALHLTQGHGEVYDAFVAVKLRPGAGRVEREGEQQLREHEIGGEKERRE